MSTKNMLKEAKAKYFKGIELQGQGNLEESVKNYHQAFEIRSDYVQPLLKLGKIYEYQENWSEAAKCYQRIIRLNSDTPSVYLGSWTSSGIIETK